MRVRADSADSRHLDAVHLWTDDTPRTDAHAIKSKELNETRCGMTFERKIVVSLDEITAVIFECTHCNARVVVRFRQASAGRRCRLFLWRKRSLEIECQALGDLDLAAGGFGWGKGVKSPLAEKEHIASALQYLRSSAFGEVPECEAQIECAGMDQQPPDVEAAVVA